MPGTALVPLAVVALALAACGGRSAEDEVRATLAGFAQATAKRDYQALCDRFLAPALVDRVEQVGLPCEAALRPEIGATRNPSLTIRSVRVLGDRATAVVRTGAANQPPSQDTVALVRVQGLWRIAALDQTGPQPPALP